jgi:hypothetical protein
MKMSHIAITGALLTAFFTGCSTTVPIPPGTPTAKIRFSSLVNDTNINGQDGESCPRMTRFYSKLIGNPVIPHDTIGVRGKPDQSAKHSTEFLAPAGKALLFSVGTNTFATQYSPGTSCTLGFSFTPETDKDYEVRYLLNNNRCGVRIFELQQTSDGAVSAVENVRARFFPAKMHEDLCPYK